MAFLPLKIFRRDADTSAVSDGAADSLSTNAAGRLKVSQWPGAYVPTTGSIVATNSVVTADVTRAGAATISVSGTYTGVNFVFEVSNDGTNFVPLAGQRVDTGAFEFNTGTIASISRVWDLTPLLGVVSIRARAVAWTSGSAVITITPSATSIENMVQLVPGTALIGSVVGNIAHGTADSGAPMKVGGKAYTANPTAVANATRSDFITDKLGKQVVVGSIRDMKNKQSTTITSSTTETVIVAAQGASVFADVYALTITNTSATATEVIIRDIAAGGTAESFMVPGGQTVGWTLTESAASKQTTANGTWTAQCLTSVASIKITAKWVNNA